MPSAKLIPWCCRRCRRPCCLNVFESKCMYVSLLITYNPNPLKKGFHGMWICDTIHLRGHQSQYHSSASSFSWEWEWTTPWPMLCWIFTFPEIVCRAIEIQSISHWISVIRQSFITSLLSEKNNRLHIKKKEMLSSSSYCCSIYIYFKKSDRSRSFN